MPFRKSIFSTHQQHHMVSFYLYLRDSNPPHGLLIIGRFSHQHVPEQDESNVLPILREVFPLRMVFHRELQQTATGIFRCLINSMNNIKLHVKKQAFWSLISIQYHSQWWRIWESNCHDPQPIYLHLSKSTNWPLYRCCWVPKYSMEWAWCRFRLRGWLLFFRLLWKRTNLFFPTIWI